MKHTLLSLALLLTPILLLCQTENRGKFTGGIQISPSLSALYSEYLLSTQSALRFEVGFSGNYGWYASKKTVYNLYPTLNLEPRWYYNLNKRAANDWNVQYNSANFLGLRVSYIPNWFIISNDEKAQTFNRFDFIPKWGIRRTVLKRINYELGFGLGYYLSDSYKGTGEWGGGVGFDLHVRLGVNLF